VKGGIGSTPCDVTYVGLWNGAVWSLPYEALAYVFFGVLVVMPRFGARASALTCAVLGLAVLLQHGVGIGSAYAPELTRLWSFFGAGVLLWFLRDRLPESKHAVAAACLLVAGALYASHTAYLVLAPIPLSFALLWLGARLPVRVGVRNDISYGMYVFAFPVQQLIAMAHVPQTVGPFGFMVVSVALTVPVAWASWLLVERPSMRLKRIVPARTAMGRSSGDASPQMAR